MNKIKKLRTVIPRAPQHWVGDGFPVNTMFSYNEQGRDLSPFLLLDYAAPTEVSPSERPRGVGKHPHRGFETVTIVYQGELEHRDSSGAGGKIGPGDVQWMTAASGIVHEEMHSREFTRKGGLLEMVQLWVNLPAKFKRSPPGYQELSRNQIPVVQFPNGAGTARIIAGAFQGTKGPARTFTPVHLWDLQLKKGHRVNLSLPPGHTTALFVLKGKILVNESKKIGSVELGLFDRQGEQITFVTQEETSLLVLNGEPIEEPMVGYGPFVMNTQEEIRQAIEDYQNRQ